MFIKDFFILWYYYSKGIAEYVKYNNNVSYLSNIKKFKLAFIIGCSKSYESLIRCDIKKLVLILYDVFHLILKYIIILSTPKFFRQYFLIWIFIYPFILPTSMKLGKYYKLGGCIRNHKNLKLDHKCPINNYYKMI